MPLPRYLKCEKYSQRIIQNNGNTLDVRAYQNMQVVYFEDLGFVYTYDFILHYHFRVTQSGINLDELIQSLGHLMNFMTPDFDVGF